MGEPLLPTLTGANRTPLSKPAAATSKTSTPEPLPPTQAQSSATSPAANSRAWIAAQVRQHLPQAQPLTATLDRWINQLNTSTAPASATSVTAKIAAPLDSQQQLITAFVDRLATAKDLVEPQRLSAVIESAGIWLEAQIAQAAADPTQPRAGLAQDLKGQLLCLAEQIRAADATSLLAASESVADSAAPAVEVVTTLPPVASGVIVEMTAPVAADAPAESDAPSESDDAELLLEPDDADQIEEEKEVDIVLDADGEDGESDADGDAAGAESEASSEGTVPLEPLDPNDATEGVEATEPSEIDISELPPDSDLDQPPLPAAEAATRTAAHHAQAMRSKQARSGTLIREIDGMIKHIVTQQLHSLSSDGTQPRWWLELPFRTPTGALLTLDTEIERENRSGRPEDERWNLRLRLNLPHIGPLSINLSLRLTRLDAGLQAGTEAGAELLRCHLETLRQQLTAQHIEIASLHAGYRPLINPPPLPCAPMIRERG